MKPRFSRAPAGLASLLGAVLTACTAPAAEPTPAPAEPQGEPVPEVRGTWVTTTGNTAIATPENTAATMKRLREIGLNTVYVECWKNGYTQFPSQVLQRTIGVDRRPNLMPQDPSDTPEALRRPARDLLGETLTEAHRQGLVYIAWFEYGFMAAHKGTMNHLRTQKPEWLSRDIKGSEVAPNGFVWLNPLHPEARRFLLDLVLEAVDKYDLDGVQLDDRIVWPYITMGYDDYTKKVYAKEHDGREPPADEKDPEWMRWRADKINAYAKQFVQELRARRPGLVISLSPAVYPWCWDHYMLEWPRWAAWTERDAATIEGNPAASRLSPTWDEYIPQNYRFSYDAFEKTWLDQVKWMNELGAGRQRDLLAGIRIVGEGKDSPWDQLKRSMDLARQQGNGGHVLWFSRGVLDVYPKELTDYYAGWVHHPKFPADWRPPSTPLTKAGDAWTAPRPADGDYHLIIKRAGVWTDAGSTPVRDGVNLSFRGGPLVTYEVTKDTVTARLQDNAEAVELLRDRRADMAKPREAR
jgi:uncharacterized lipoprotein YddW (UPF0748 family)